MGAKKLIKRTPARNAQREGLQHGFPLLLPPPLSAVCSFQVWGILAGRGAATQPGRGSGQPRREVCAQGALWDTVLIAIVQRARRSQCLQARMARQGKKFGLRPPQVHTCICVALCLIKGF